VITFLRNKSFREYSGIKQKTKTKTKSKTKERVKTGPVPHRVTPVREDAVRRIQIGETPGPQEGREFLVSLMF